MKLHTLLPGTPSPYPSQPTTTHWHTPFDKGDFTILLGASTNLKAHLYAIAVMYFMVFYTMSHSLSFHIRNIGCPKLCGLSHKQ